MVMGFIVIFILVGGLVGWWWTDWLWWTRGETRDDIEEYSRGLERMKEFFFCDALISPFSLVTQN